MGKLHTLRRSILRDPEKWKGAHGAYLDTWGWSPAKRWKTHKSYKGFVESVLKHARVGHPPTELNRGNPITDQVNRQGVVTQLRSAEK